MKGRVWGSWALLVVTWLLLLASLTAVWTRSVLLNSDRFTATLAPVLRDERVIEAVSERVSAGVISALGVGERLQETFPGRAGALAAAQITISAQEAVEQRTVRLMHRERLQDLLLNTVHAAHGRALNVLRGGSDVATVSDGTLTLNLLPLVREVLSDLPGVGQLLSEVRLPELGTEESPTAARRRLEAALGRPLPADAGQITLLEAQGLQSAQQAVGVLDSLALVLPLLLAGCGALAVYLAPNRMRTGAILALGGAVSLLLLVVLLRLVGPQVATAAGSDPLTLAVAQSLVQSLVGSLAGAAVVLALIALAVGAGLLFLERSRRTPPAPAAEPAGPAPGAEVVTG
jgi:hypothetical protein